MKLLFLGKRNVPGCERAQQFCRTQVDDLLCFLGARGEPLPAAAREWRGDYIISYLSPWIVPERLLRAARIAAINFHPGPPEYPGTGCTNFALYEGATRYGVTCHHMEKSVDTGRLIAVRRFPIKPTDTVWSVNQRSHAEIFDLFHEVVALLLRGAPLPEASQQWTRRPFTRGELDALCEVTAAMPEAEIARRVRATEFPGMPGAFLSIGERRYPFAKRIRVEIVVPVRNEAEMIPIFIDRILSLKLPPVVDLSLRFVEDGSTDDTKAVLAESARRLPNVSCVSLRRGMGQAPAVAYGLSRSNADAVIMMDADCGHSPDVVPRMIESFLEGHEVVQATRTDPDEPTSARAVAAAAFNSLARLLTGVDLNTQNVYFRLVSRERKQELLEAPGFARFLRIPELSKRRVDYIGYRLERRPAGDSKYGLLRLLGFSLVGLLALTSRRRLALLGALALAPAALLWLAGFCVAAGAILTAVVLLAAGWFWVSHSNVLTRLEPV